RACLTVIRGWIAAGRPLGSKVIGSFEEWARVIGGILEYVGITGFLDRDALDDLGDTETLDWQDFIEHWWTEWGPKPVTVSDLLDFCETNELLDEIRGDGNEHSQRTKLGQALTSKRDVMFDDIKLVVVQG